LTNGRRFQLFTSVAALFLVGPAHAGEMLLYGPGVPSTEMATQAETVLRIAADVKAPSGGTSHVLDLPFPSSSAVWASGDLLPLPCGDSGLSTVVPADIVAEATELVDELSYDKALLRLEGGIRALPCVATEVSRQTLTDLYFFLGLAEFEEGNAKKAKRAFASVLAIDVNRPWDNDYPPDPQALFNEARTDLVAATAPTVAVDLRGGQVTDFRVDGEVLDVGTAHALQLHRGKHLIQYTGADGISISNLVNVGRGGGDFVSREALRNAVLNLAWKPVTARAAESVLAEMGRSRGVDEVYVVLLADDTVSRAYKFIVSTAAVLPLNVDSDALAKATKAGGTAPVRKPIEEKPDGVSSEADMASGRVGLVVDGGLHVGNFEPYALVTLRADFRLLAGFELGVGAYIGVTSVEDMDEDGQSTSGTWLLPGATVGARYRFNLGAAHPYLGGRGVIAASELENAESASSGTGDVFPAGGGGFLAGIDITPGNTKGLVINIDFLAGYWKLADVGGGLLLDITAGVGVRF
jgi:hypothetical protein